MPRVPAFFSGYRRVFAVMACLCLVAALAGCTSHSTPPPFKGTSQNHPAGQPQRRSALGYGDEVSIQVWRNDDLKTTARVDAAGNINLPLVGEVPAGGRTVSELRVALAKAYAKYIVDPQVMVNVSTLRSQTAMVLGEVKSQGVVTVDHDMSLFEAVARAGGFTDNAGNSTVVLLRPEGDKPHAYILDMRLGSKLGEGVAGFDRYLEGGDILYVPKSDWASVEQFMGRMTSVLNTLVNAERFVIFIPQLRDAMDDLFKGPKDQTTVVTQSQPVAGEVLSNRQGGVISVD
ncbi:MAG: polysaccharide biosynthesis/export family protein [Desulfovibrio sp.]